MKAMTVVSPHCDLKLKPVRQYSSCCFPALSSFTDSTVLLGRCYISLMHTG